MGCYAVAAMLEEPPRRYGSRQAHSTSERSVG
jgi:hypothetical protein